MSTPHLSTADYDYDLPAEQIAQTPLERRDHSRLLCLDRRDGGLRHRRFFQIVDELQPGDTLVLNDSRVMPARLHGTRVGSGGAVELLLLHRIEDKTWETLVRPGRKLPPGARIRFGPKLEGVVKQVTASGGRIVQFHCEGSFQHMLAELGRTPLPPYIHQELPDANRYQTVYASKEGSAAAPTAGLHFTPSLLQQIEKSGVTLAYLTLHVGVGTFRPVKAADVREHTMHAEYYMVSPQTAAALAAARQSGGRIIAVGTTVVRTLETLAHSGQGFQAGSGWTDIFIYPGHRFQAVDALVTNFHLPRSTLLMLVSAFAGREVILHAYSEAIASGYRFFSFGDAMFIG